MGPQRIALHSTPAHAGESSPFFPPRNCHRRQPDQNVSAPGLSQNTTQGTSPASPAPGGTRVARAELAGKGSGRELSHRQTMCLTCYPLHQNFGSRWDCTKPELMRCMCDYMFLFDNSEALGASCALCTRCAQSLYKTIPKLHSSAY